MDEHLSDERVFRLADEFIERKQRGETPSIEEYCLAHPQFASEIRDLFPTLLWVEDLQLAGDESNGQVEGSTAPPERIGGYTIVRQIGRGGMGAVYEAVQESLNRRVALKILPKSRHLGESAHLRFQREARAAARLHHTNIVPIFEVGQSEEHYFYAMQLIVGKSLEQVINELRSLGTAGESDAQQPTNRLRTESREPDITALSRRPVHDAEEPAAVQSSELTTSSLDGSGTGSDRHPFFQSASRIAVQVAEALQYAHERGIVHRDVKPSNLLLDPEGVVWVADFGLAKTEDEGMTRTGDFLGTLRYMAPERFRGLCDERADVYALGLTLYELIVLAPGLRQLRSTEAHRYDQSDDTTSSAHAGPANSAGLGNHRPQGDQQGS